MVDARTFWVGAFMTLWVVMFFCVSAYELFKTRPGAIDGVAPARGPIRSLENVIGREGAGRPSAKGGSDDDGRLAKVLGPAPTRRVARDLSVARGGRIRGASRARGSA